MTTYLWSHKCTNCVWQSRAFEFGRPDRKCPRCNGKLTIFWKESTDANDPPNPCESGKSEAHPA